MLRQVTRKALRSATSAWTLRFSSPALTVNYSSKRSVPGNRGDESEFDSNVVNLPSDLNLLRRLNPELHSAVVQSKVYERESYRQNLAEKLRKRLEEHGHQAPRSQLSPSALSKLPVSILRRELACAGGEEVSGNKNMVVTKLLELLGEKEEGRRQPDKSPARAVASATFEAKPAGPFGRFRVVPREKPAPKQNLPMLRADSREIAGALAAAHASNVVALDVSKCCSFTEALVVATGRSAHQLRAQAQAVVHWLEKQADDKACAPYPAVIEGEQGAEWLVVDAGTTLVHLMVPQTRAYYDLEGLWQKQGARLESIPAEDPAPETRRLFTLDNLRLNQDQG